MAPSNSAANTGNAIAQASLDESKRQFETQQAEKNRQKAAAKSNAKGGLISANMTYSNMFQQSNNLTMGNDNSNVALISPGLNNQYQVDTLGGGNSTLG